MKKYNVEVIYEDNHLLVVNKPAGMLVQGDHTKDYNLIDWGKNYIKKKYEKPGAVFLGLPHRLDRVTSGIVVLARTSKALERMNKLFADRKIQKTYWAVVKRRPPKWEEKLVHYIKKNEEKNTVECIEEALPDYKKAELTYKSLGKRNEHYLLEVKPKTGRKHQIRAQLSAIGCPIRGDLKYGFHQPNKDKQINLHAFYLYFIHPVKNEPIYLRAGLPDNDFWEQFLVLERKAEERHMVGLRGAKE
jgi:23S rRNA pseudouridine1911/1915/1917 synthase